MCTKSQICMPNDPGKLYSVFERKAAGWAVMDANTRLNDSAAGKGAKGDHKGAYSATIPCKHFAKCRFSHKSLVSQPAAMATKARKRTAKGIGARSWDKSRIRHIEQNRVQRILPLLRKLC